MKSLRWSASLFALAVLVAALTTACRPTFVVLPGPASDSTADSVQVRERVRTVVRYDTVFRVDTVQHVRVDTVGIPVYGTHTERVDTVVRVDTVRVIERVVRTDTIYRSGENGPTDATGRRPTLPGPRRTTAVDTVFRLRVDTVQVPGPTRVDTVDGPARVDTVLHTDTLVRVDTVRMAGPARVDTVRVTETVVRADTVRVAGQRLLFLPPGHYPPEGQCRVWVHGTPPGQQARAAPCDRLGTIPAGAFILFGGDAWDFDYDWLAAAEAAPGSVPPQIIALKRR